MLGQRFGRYTVIEKAGYHTSPCGQKQAMWKCRCDCGTVKTVIGAALRRGNTKSCGCLKLELLPLYRFKLPEGHSIRNKVLGTYKHSAKVRKLIWQLTDVQFDILTQQNCHYCGTAPTTVRQIKNLNGPFVYNGIDRKNNSKGHTPDNVVSCCEVCNKMKLTMSIEKFLAHVQRIVAHIPSI
jgi:5-methylcytosine-specific restriction endonuclease McrA